MGPYKPLLYKVDEFIPTIGKQWELIDPIAQMAELHDFWGGPHLEDHPT